MEVGDKIWLHEHIGHSSHIIETTIKSIGRKYITVECSPKKKFYIKNLQQKDDCGISDFLIKDIKQYVEREKRRKKVNKLLRFNWKRLNADDLEQVLNILSNYKEEN